jgi:hypothetical protein
MKKPQCVPNWRRRRGTTVGDRHPLGVHDARGCGRELTDRHQGWRIAADAQMFHVPRLSSGGPFDDRSSQSVPKSAPRHASCRCLRVGTPARSVLHALQTWWPSPNRVFALTARPNWTQSMVIPERPVHATGSLAPGSSPWGRVPQRRAVNGLAEQGASAASRGALRHHPALASGWLPCARLPTEAASDGAENPLHKRLAERVFHVPQFRRSQVLPRKFAELSGQLPKYDLSITVLSGYSCGPVPATCRLYHGGKV